MKKNNKSIIILSIIFILLIAVGVVIYLFIGTDLFKSNEKSFLKYFAQNTETFQSMLNSNIQITERLASENKYESKSNIKMAHSEGGEISNIINDFSAQIDIQNDNEKEYFYADAQMIYKEEECIEAEIIKEQGQYGIKFPGIARKFVTIQNDEKLESVANDFGIDKMYFELIMNIIEGNVQMVSKEQITALKNKYLNIITTESSKGIFGKQKNAIITYNDVTIETNAYSLLLNSNQVGKLLTEILNNLKSETQLLNEIQKVLNIENIENLIDEKINSINEELEVPPIKITTYEQKQKTIRTVFEIGVNKIIIENTNINNEIKSNIGYITEALEYEFQISKVNNENEEKFQISINTINEEEENTIILSNEMQLLENEIDINTEISHKQDITTKSLIIENKVFLGNNFEKIQSLTTDNSILLNTLEEGVRQQFIAELKERMPQRIDDKIEDKIEDVPNENDVEEEISQVEINKFNAKFEFYTGDEVSEENVKKLLDIVKNNIVGHVITTVENPDTTNNKKEKNMITIYIEKDKTNDESMTKILENIEKNKKYKISISYKDSNGLIESISIIQK